LCSQKGSLLYSKKTDQLFRAPGTWDMWKCPLCGLIWLNPFPSKESLGIIYEGYYTHASTDYFINSTKAKRIKDQVVNYFQIQSYLKLGYRDPLTETRRIFAFNLGPLPFLGKYDQLSIMNVRSSWGKRILDVGAGNGEYLKLMSSLGWEVEGTETDKSAIDFAQSSLGITMHHGFITDLKLPAASYDVITMNHVLEHVYDPVSVLIECKRLLRPGGRLVILTPNSASLGHRWFRSNWRGHEIPRHMNVFSVRNFRILTQKTGLKIETLESTARIARYLYSTSKHIEEGRTRIGRGGNRGAYLTLRSILFQVYEELALLFDPEVGEEIVFVGVKE